MSFHIIHVTKMPARGTFGLPRYIVSPLSFSAADLLQHIASVRHDWRPNEWDAAVMAGDPMQLDQANRTALTLATENDTFCSIYHVATTWRKLASISDAELLAYRPS